MQRAGDISAEARALHAQRNLALNEVRKRSSPFGRKYAEILKPLPPTYEELLARKGSDRAIIRSAGKTRAVVNRLTVITGLAGSTAIVLQITLSVVLIVRARPEDRSRIAASQAGAIGGGLIGGWGGAWAGCASLAALASPTLVVPIVGEISTGGACLIGGIAGGLGFGALGAWAGEQGADIAHDYLTRLDWLRK